MTSADGSANISDHGYDLSTIKPLGAYPATQCPVRTQFRVLPPAGVEPTPVGDVLQARFDAANEFEALVFATIGELHPDALRITDGCPEDMTAATVAAMRRQVPLILGGWLPVDERGRRTGKPDILLHDEDGYLPVDVKVYALLHDEPQRPSGPLTSTLARPGLDGATEVAGTLTSNKRRRAALQLAHYWRMLEACGEASSRGAHGAIIDSSERLVWIDLNAPQARIQNRGVHLDEPVTWLRAYDHEFGFRRDVAAHTVLIRDGHLRNGAPLAPKVLPVAIAECASCEWNVHCRPDLEARDHLSLLPSMDYWAQRQLRLAGLTTRRDVADRDYFTAAVVKRLSPAQLRAVLDPANAQTPLADLWARAVSVVPFATSLAAQGTVTGKDLASRLTDEVAISLEGKLNPVWIDQARASVLGTPLLARGFTELRLPAFDVEVDFDMENDLDGRVYLWGLLATIDGERQDYEVIDRYDAGSARLEAELFSRFWRRVHQLRDDARATGRTFGLFHWSRAELTMARRICTEGSIDGLPAVDAVDAFFAASCTDLEAVLHAHFVMPSGSSVKKVAPLAGHDWSAVHDLEDTDDGEGANGDVSMIKHRLAVEAPTEAERRQAKHWLRTYNEADVDATRVVRQWMREAVTTLPRTDDEPSG